MLLVVLLGYFIYWEKDQVIIKFKGRFGNVFDLGFFGLLGIEEEVKVIGELFGVKFLL